MNEADHTPGVQAYIRRGSDMLAAQAAHRERMRRMKFDTIAVGGMYGVQAAAENMGSLNEPLYLSPAQVFDNSDHLEAALAYWMPAWTYSRYGNPTNDALEQTLALLEGYGGDYRTTACATGSGMAAIHMATGPFLVDYQGPAHNVPNASSGRANIVACAKIYGGTFMFFQQHYGVERGVEIRWVRDPLDLDEWASRIDANTRFVYGEMPSNPSLALFDIESVAELGHDREIPLIVDATVATPALMRPLAHGADIVVHSVSKSMASNGFAIAGALISKENITAASLTDEVRNDFAGYVKRYPFRDYGPALSPFNALMILNDLRMLRSRMDVLSKNTLQIAEFLTAQPQVEAVWYPGLSLNQFHALARRYLRLVDAEVENRYGHLLSFSVRGGVQAARQVYDRLGLIWRATDLGRVKSVATIPAISTHQQQGDEGRSLAELPPNLIRLSVGAEHPEDIIADLEQALRQA